jgi:hypothetical protein
MEILSVKLILSFILSSFFGSGSFMVPIVGAFCDTHFEHILSKNESFAIIKDSM